MLLGLGNRSASKQAGKRAICHAVRGSVSLPACRTPNAIRRRRIVQSKESLHLHDRKRDTLSQNCGKDLLMIDFFHIIFVNNQVLILAKKTVVEIMICI
jgi:hypothetical protein